MKTKQKKTKNYARVKPRKRLWVPKPFRKGWFLSRRVNQLVRNSITESDFQKLNNIEGYLHGSEGMILFYFAFKQKVRGRVVEIGTFKGKSTAWIATGLKLRGEEEKVITIDPHIKTGDINVIPDYEEISSYEAFKANISELRLSPRVEEKVATSEHANIGWKEPIRLLFIDGSHRYEDVFKDTQLWMPWITESGIACFHDTNPSCSGFPGVCRAMKGFFQEHKYYKKLLELKNMEVYKKAARFRLIK